MWFDDLHLSSPNTFEVLGRLRRAPSALRVLAIATARSETLATDLDAALRLEAARADWGGEVLELLPLAPEETQALLKATLPLASDAVQKGVEQSHGNPLFALQLLHAWAGGGYLKLNGSKYEVPSTALEGRAITTAELWDERLRAVPTDLRLAAYAAAALGEDIRGEVLEIARRGARHGPARRGRGAHARANPPRVGQRSIPLAARAAPRALAPAPHRA